MEDQDRDIAYRIVRHKHFERAKLFGMVMCMFVLILLGTTGHGFHVFVILVWLLPLRWMGWKNLHLLAAAEWAFMVKQYRLLRDQHCAVLQVAVDASNAEIRRAYHRLALRYHPDRGMDSTESKWSSLCPIVEARSSSLACPRR